MCGSQSHVVEMGILLLTYRECDTEFAVSLRNQSNCENISHMVIQAFEVPMNAFLHCTQLTECSTGAA